MRMPRKFGRNASKLPTIWEIIDNLQSRDIIKTSISPYCARIVLICKKKRNLRPCIDLRPLNNRIAKQKYPFPLTICRDSQIKQSSLFSTWKMIFSKLKCIQMTQSVIYFSFATPDGQFEYNRLPFGFCDAFAEFQKTSRTNPSTVY